jgi:rubrerythrin
VLITSNAKPSSFLLEYRRRSVVFDTRAIEGDLPVNRSRPFRDFLDALPRWDIDQLVPPDWPLGPILDAVNATIIPGLNEDGRRLYDEGTLALLVLGRAAWTGLGLEQAVQAVVADYLDTAATVDETLRPVATNLALPDAFARRLADEHRARDEAERRRRARLDTLALEARKGQVLADLDALAEQLSSDGPRLRQIDVVRAWVEGAETAEELHDLIGDLGELREATPIVSDEDDEEAADWWCPSCGRLLDDEDEEAGVCPVCGEAEQVRPATTWEVLGAHYSPPQGVPDIPSSPSGSALPGARPKAALPRWPTPPVYVGACGCRFDRAFLDANSWSTSVTCPRHRRWVAWTTETSRPVLPRGELDWTAHTDPNVLLTGNLAPPRSYSLVETFRRAYFGAS